MIDAIFGVVCGIAAMIIILAAVGNPPKHCQYMVPMKSHPGVYACSQHPLPKP